MKPFETVVEHFKAFLVQQGYPPKLLWLTSDDVVVRGRRYFFWKGDPSERQRRAQAVYEIGVAQNLPIACKAKCKTEHWTICRVYVAGDSIDAQYRLMPEGGVKLSSALH